MRTTTHNARAHKNGQVFSAKHNDRNYDVDHADNIIKDRMSLNQYINYYNDDKMTFEKVELKFYNDNFSHQLKKINDSYIAGRHKEKVKTMQQWKNLKRYCPEETHFQIGKIEDHVDRNTLIKVFNTFNKKMIKWSKENNYPFTVLNIALHCDEEVPHIQQRRVWHYKDDDGNLCVGQTKALEKTNLTLPDPNKKVSKKNNLKQSFSKVERELWLESCKEFNIDIELIPAANVAHNRTKEELINDKYQKKLDKIKQMNTIINEKDYIEKSQNIQNNINTLNAVIDDIQFQVDNKNKNDDLSWTHIYIDLFKNFLNDIKLKINDMKIFEFLNNKISNILSAEHEEKVSKLDDRIKEIQKKTSSKKKKMLSQEEKER